ncbi:MAG TPA: hypothetical protein VFK39_14940 [Gemmatimonadaceae bacterium]|nr:hypothetical protein [Gemmatimonadaceae bacterium]
MDSTKWDKQLAQVDRALEGISDEALLPDDSARQPSPAARKARKQEVKEERYKTTTLGVMARLVLAVALGVGMLFWPYSARCGVGLFGYLGAAAMVVVAGGWSSIWSWRHRSGQAHVLSLLLIVWGVVLGATEILPRVGYAIPDAQHPAIWMCE